MNQGFGGTKDCLLEKYALRFIKEGVAVLTYDYRHFGDSEGQPRQLYEVTYQLEDLRAAIAYARDREEIDPEKIVLWGTSASGGYGLVVAAEDKRIAAVIAQCAGIDHEADDKLFLEREGYRFFIRLLVHAQRDKGRSRLGLSPHKLPIVGRPGTVALLTAPGAFDGYASLFSESETFENEVCARLFFMTHGPDPNEAALEVSCPVLFLVCEQDNLVAPDSHVKAAGALGDKAVVKSYPIGHFDIYRGVYFQEAVNEMIALIKDVCLLK
jgi:pimeloyl-ACP methyl ester carboxylesterase